MFSVRSVLTSSIPEFSVLSEPRLCKATLGIFAASSVRSSSQLVPRREVNAVTVLVQWRVKNSRGRSTQRRQRIGTRNTEELTQCHMTETYEITWLPVNQYIPPECFPFLCFVYHIKGKQAINSPQNFLLHVSVFLMSSFGTKFWFVRYI
jgi:hypothetical protein